MNVLCHPGGRELLALDNSTGLPLVFQNCFPSYLLKFSSREESEKEQNRIRKSLRGVVKSCVGLFLNPQRRTKTNQTETERRRNARATHSRCIGKTRTDF